MSEMKIGDNVKIQGLHLPDAWKRVTGKIVAAYETSDDGPFDFRVEVPGQKNTLGFFKEELTVIPEPGFSVPEITEFMGFLLEDMRTQLGQLGEGGTVTDEVALMDETCRLAHSWANRLEALQEQLQKQPRSHP